MARYSNYTLTELKCMAPYEFDIFSAILYKQIQQERENQNHG